MMLWMSYSLMAFLQEMIIKINKMKLKSLLNKKQILTESAASDWNTYSKLWSKREKMEAELEEISAKIDEIRLSLANLATTYKAKDGKSTVTVYKRNSDGIEWYHPGPGKTLYWKIGDEFTNKKVKHDDPEWGNDLSDTSPQLKKIAIAVYKGPIVKK